MSGHIEESSSARARAAVWLDRVLSVLPMLGMALVLALVGWPLRADVAELLVRVSRWLAVAYALVFVIQSFVARSVGRERLPLLAVAVLILASAAFEDRIGMLTSGMGIEVPPHMLLVAVAALQQVLALATRIPAWLPYLERSFLQRVSPGAVLVVTFAILILFGTLLLKMPNATASHLSWLDALFTSTSAVCVTGLIVVDTATAFTPLGQGIILLLIQLGAFGIVTITFFLAVVSGQGFSVSSRAFLGEMLSVRNLRQLNTAIAFIIGSTFIFEGVGAFLIYHWWSGPLPEGGSTVWFSLFHSVSAFCNAGFSTFTQGLADPAPAGNHAVLGVIMVLIVAGGIGFPAYIELMGILQRRVRSWRGKPAERPRMSLHLRLVLLLTVGLIAGGTLLFFVGELPYYDGAPDHLLWVSLFNSITARTAGFYVSDIGLMPSAPTAVLILLMFIGGCPGGIAGGIKTTTFAISMLNLRRILLGRREINLFGRRVEEAITSRAFAVLMLSQAWILLATVLILYTQPGLHLIDVLFETVSAFSTVGLSRGITGELSAFSRVVIIATMFVGRIGILNFFFSFTASRVQSGRISYPQGRVIVE